MNYPKSFSCSRWKEGCGFTIWKIIARKKISEKRKGIIFTKEHRENLKLSHLGKKHTEEQKKKISDSLKGKSKILKLVTCPHCNKCGKGSNMTRYHFSNCGSIDKQILV